MHNPEPAPLLTADEERSLARDIEAGVLAEHLLATGERPVAASADELRAVVAAGASAWQRFLLANLRLVWKLAGREARRTGLPAAELSQEGFVALAGALQRFDPARGRFSTFATIRVSQHLAQVGSARFGEVALAPGQAARLRRARGLAAALGQEQGRVPAVVEVAAELGECPETTERLLAYRPPLPLDLVADGAGLPEPRPLDPDLALYTAQLRRLLGRLDPEQAGVVALRYGFVTGEPVEATAVAQRLRLSLSTVRRIERRALAALRPFARALDPRLEEPLAG